MAKKYTDILFDLGIGSTTAQQLFWEHATLVERPKTTTVFAAGKKNDKEYIILAGIVQRFIEQEGSSPVTTGFFVAPAVVTPHFARTHRGKSLFSLQALTDVVAAEIPVAALDALRTEYPEFRAFGQRVLEGALVAALHAEAAWRASTARQRLLAMRQQFPNLENSVPHHVIASYLGITHVSFSRLRHELARSSDFIK